MKHPLQCRCGTVRGYVTLPAMTSRAICYCKDCQAFARFLGPAAEILDEAGGTEIVASLPRRVHFEHGIESLACMSLAEGGMLRWYASCCKTPIGNTARGHKISYVGLVHSCLSSQSMEQSFGPVRIQLHPKSAKRPIKSTGPANLQALLKLMKTIVLSRLSGRYRENPFFHARTGEPIQRPRVLSVAERSKLDEAA